MTETEALLYAENMTVCYNGKPVVEDVSFTLKPGEILGVVGESGSGKSTILKAILGLLGEDGTMTRGDIWYRGENVADMPKKRLRKLLGPEIGMVFQDAKSALCPIRKIGDQIYESVSEHKRISKKEVWKQAGALMEKIGLSDYQRILKSYPFELSGGMNQRVGIVTAMIMKPALLLADEPTSALDVTVQAQVVQELSLLRREYHTALILVTHNIGVVGALADKVLVLKNGKTMDYGPAERVLHHSESGYTKELMDAVLHLKRGTA